MLLLLHHTAGAGVAGPSDLFQEDDNQGCTGETSLSGVAGPFWQNSCFHSVVSKQDFFKFLWHFQKSWTLTCSCRFLRNNTLEQL